MVIEYAEQAVDTATMNKIKDKAMELLLGIILKVEKNGRIRAKTQ